MRILQLSNKLPYPPRDGGALATLNMALGLADAGLRVHNHAMNTSRHFFPVSSIPENLLQKIHFSATPVDTDIKPLPALLALLKNESYNLVRFQKREFETDLKNILKTEEAFDAFILEGLYLCPYIPLLRKHSRAPILFRAHNIEHRIWERRADHEKSAVKKWYLKKLAGQLKAAEEKLPGLADAIIPISPIDAEWFSQKFPDKTQFVYPAGITRFANRDNINKVNRKSLCFIGALDWYPNIEGLNWFLEKVWPDLIEKDPEITLHVAGRNMPDSLKKRSFTGVSFYGEVPDSKEFIQDHHVVIAPLFSGSGMRVKIVEAMALGKAVITTDVGREGLALTPEEHFMLANTPETFADAILKLTQNDDLGEKIRLNAWLFARDNFHLNTITEGLVLFIQNQKLS
jgi:polysaccharide biosynthesis protein PslH